MASHHRGTGFIHDDLGSNDLCNNIALTHLFPPSTLVFHCQYHSISAPYSCFIHQPSTVHNPSNQENIQIGYFFLTSHNMKANTFIPGTDSVTYACAQETANP
jgi:hypothetical protein